MIGQPTSTHPRVAQLMAETGMGEVQAYRHLRDRDELLRRHRRLKMRVLR